MRAKAVDLTNDVSDRTQVRGQLGPAAVRKSGGQAHRLRVMRTVLEQFRGRP
jgi:ABC-type transport system involved in cytochrome bd biosynthesis fused ATPase/permease subunit